MTTVREAAASQEPADRKRVRARRRLAWFKGKILKAPDGTERVRQACYYAQAVAADLDENSRNALAKALAETADRWNPR